MNCNFVTLISVAAVTALLAASALADDVSFNYQGRVRVQGTLFNGTGHFKFSILNTSATVTLWSNDGTPSGEPVASVNITVQDGLFSVEIGSPSLGMQPINSSIFSSRTPLKLRTWFDGGQGFQQLSPDQTLVDLTLNTVATGTQPYTIYVDGTNGNDDRNGLTTNTAKKTIQSAVNAVPRQLLCTVTVQVLPGIYREFVNVSGISGAGFLFEHGIEGNHLIIQGDTSWTPSMGGQPNVCITGCDEDVTSTPVRRYGILCHNNTSVTVRGILFSYVTHAGIRMETGTYVVNDCKATRSASVGFLLSTGVSALFERCLASYNTHGFYDIASACIIMYTCTAEYNTECGAYANISSNFSIYSGTFRNNGVGCSAVYNSMIHFFGPTIVQGNGVGLAANNQSYIQGTSNATLSGNGASQTGNGGAIYN